MIASGLRQYSGKIGYRIIVDHVIDAVSAKHLVPGEKLPPQRDLAQDIGVAVATVGRAYTELEAKGFVASHVGRGTFIAMRPPIADEPGGRAASQIELGIYRAPVPSGNLRLPELLRTLAATPRAEALLGSAPTPGFAHHRATVAQWSERFGIMADPDDIILSNGGNHAVTAALSGLTPVGANIATEELTDPRMKAVANFLGRRLVGIGCDSDGMLPDELNAACRKEQISALYCTPVHHNPTNVTMSAARRAAIVEVARHHDLTIIESNIYGTIAPCEAPPLRQLAPERTYFILSLGRIIGAGIKVGWLVCPPGMARHAQIGVAMTTGIASPLMVELACQLIDNGRLEELSCWQQDENRHRLSILRRFPLLSQAKSSPTSAHVWLNLPEAWRAEDLVEYAAKDLNISIAATHTFVVGRRSVPHSVRLVIGSPESQGQLTTACEGLEQLISHAPRPSAERG